MSEISPIQGVQYILEDTARRFRVTVEGVEDIDSVAASEIYKDGKGSDLAATLLSGTATEAGNVIVTESVTAGASDGGHVYIMFLNYVLDGKAKGAKIQLNVVEKKSIIAPYTT